MRDLYGNRYEYGWTATDEIAFITGLATGRASVGRVRCENGWANRGANLSAFREYARLVMSGMREYDKSVNVDAVKLCVLELMKTEAAA